jgi:hypothetical protein
MAGSLRIHRTNTFAESDVERLCRDYEQEGSSSRRVSFVGVSNASRGPRAGGDNQIAKDIYQDFTKHGAVGGTAPTVMLDITGGCAANAAAEFIRTS